MASLNSYHYFTPTTTFTFLFLLLLHHILTPVSCYNKPQPPPVSHRELLFEEKNRLGSIPPSCHNKCNECHPCMAVQVPTLPTHNNQDLTKSRKKGLFSSSLEGNRNSNRYSNYKPLGWKCHCGNHFFNP
ncbi:hypothetical protein HN51_013995 [Arachis hypogaea]|nr:EPIDERMAL PATTERNING FACTOR-like protein 1 [Arachis hypogaea]QHO59865.1 EPIDERMAL PATTERNING FACTOR-like protein [Arachis hypogaea]